MTNDPRDERLREEKLALLKMKQGVIEESEIIPEDEKPAFERPRGFKRVENFFYLNKWIVIPVIIIIAVAVYLLVQTLTRKTEDLKVLMISTNADVELISRSPALEAALAEFCGDMDNNGYANVGIVFVDFIDVDIGDQYAMAQLEKFWREIDSCECQMIITDDGFMDLLARRFGEQADVFIDLSDKYPENILYNNKGVYLNKTLLPAAANWPDCPDNVLVYLRAPLDTPASQRPSPLAQHERAAAVLDSIIR